MLILDRVRLHDKTYRIVPSKYPAVSFFESCAHPQDLESLYLLEGLTNSRLRQEAGILSRVAEEDRISGPGSTAIMASFTHEGMASRFADGSYGVYCAAIKGQVSDLVDLRQDGRVQHLELYGESQSIG
jgi:hypothetical protein